jgi:hypothetical protein
MTRIDCIVFEPSLGKTSVALCLHTQLFGHVNSFFVRRLLRLYFRKKALIITKEFTYKRKNNNAHSDVVMCTTQCLCTHKTYKIFCSLLQRLSSLKLSYEQRLSSPCLSLCRLLKRETVHIFFQSLRPF